jgi:hypothetical protein
MSSAAVIVDVAQPESDVGAGDQRGLFDEIEARQFARDTSPKE